MQVSRILSISPLIFAAASICGAQDSSRLMQDPTVKAALDAAKRNEPHFIDEQIRICEIPAPPFHEDARGKELERLFKQSGLRDVRIDKAGNVIGVRPGAAAHPNLLFQAHLDTVFPEETNVKVTREGDLLKGPGIGDDCRGLAMMLAVIKALDEGNVKTPGTITFAANLNGDTITLTQGLLELTAGTGTTTGTGTRRRCIASSTAPSGTPSATRAWTEDPGRRSRPRTTT